MAISARDLYFAVRVEDRASRPLRQIASSFRVLGKSGLADKQRNVSQARVLKERAQQSRRLAANELMSVRSGTQKLTLEKQLAAQSLVGLKNKLKEAGVLQQMSFNYANMQKEAAELSKIDRALASKRGALPKRTISETVQLREASATRLAAFNREEELLADKAGVASGELRNQTIQVERLSAAEAELAAKEQLLKERFLTRSDAGRLANQRFTDAEIALRKFPYERLQHVGQLMGRLGRGLAIVGAIGVFAFAAMAKGASDFATESVIAATQSTAAGQNTVKQVRQNAKYIEKAVLDLMASGKAVAPSKEITQSVYEVFSGVTIPGDQQKQLKTGIQLVKEFNKVTAANFGLVTLEESTKAGIIIMNRFSLSASQVPKALNTMQAAVRFGRMTMSEYIQTLNQAAPAAQAAGQTFTEMSGAMAFLSRQFPSVRMASTGYARLLEILGRKEVTEGLRSRGVEITRNGKLLPLEEIIARIRKGFPTIKEGGLFVQNFFKEIGNQQGTIQARRAFQSFIQQFGLFHKISSAVARDKNELKKSLEAASEAPGVKWAEFLNQLKAVSYSIGMQAIPAFQKLGGYVRKVADWFNGLAPAQKRAIGYFGAFAAMGTVVGGALLVIIGGLTSLYATLRMLLIGRTAVGVLGAEAGFASTRFLLMFGVLGPLLFILIKYPDTFEKITHAIGGTQGALKALSAVVIALTFRQMIAGLAGLAIQARIATGAMSGLQAAMLRFWPLLVIALTVELYMNREQLHQKALELGDYIKKEYRDFKKRVDDSIPGIFKPSKGAQRAIEKWANSVWGVVKKVAPVTTGVFGAAFFGKSGTPEVPPITAPPNPELRDKQIMRAMGRVRAHKRTIKHAAEILGVDPTEAFKEVYENYLEMRRQVKLHPTSFTAQMNLADAADQLKAFTKEQQAAARATATALLKVHKKYSDDFVLAEFKRIRQLEKLAKKEKTFAAWKEYYTALAKLQKNATDVQMNALDSMFNTVNGKTKKSADKAKQLMKSVLDGVQSMYDDFLSKNQQAFGTLFQGKWITGPLVSNRLEWSQKLRTGDLLKDLRMQVTGFQKWRNQLNTLQGKNVPAALVKQIQELGPEAAGEQLALLNRMTPAQLNTYVNLWKKAQKEIEQATKQDTERQIKIYKQFGQKVALAIIQGIRSENPRLTNVLRNMIHTMFPDITKSGGHGMKTSTGGRGTGGTTHTHHHTHYHVKTTGKEHDVKKQIKDATWHHKSRFDRRGGR